jgi:DNA polymerase-1
MFDIEGDELLHTVKNIWCIVTQDIDSGEVRQYPPELVDEGIEALKKADMLSGHNIIGYDLPAIWKLKGEWDVVPLILDTLVTSRFLLPERFGGHSLEAWGKRLGHRKIEFSDFSKYTPEMLEYCTGDVGLNVKVYRELEKEHGAAFEGYKVYH